MLALVWWLCLVPASLGFQVALAPGLPGSEEKAVCAFYQNIDDCYNFHVCQKPITADYCDSEIFRISWDSSSVPHVVGIFKNHSSLFSSLKTVPTEIGWLTYLKTLEMARSDLTDLPVQIGQLSSLLSVDLSWNKFSTIPTILGSLSLTELYLSHNQLTVIPSTQLPSTISSLDLSANRISSINFPNGFSPIHLDLSWNELRAVPSQIGTFTNLTYLALSNNLLTTLKLTQSLFNLRSLQVLDCSNNGFSVVPSQIGQLSQLAMLLLENNRLKELPPQIGILPHLQTLRLAKNTLTSLPSLAKMGSGIPPEEVLTIHAAHNNITEIPLLPPHLWTLNMSYNNLTSIPDTQFSGNLLVELDLSHNQITNVPQDLTDNAFLEHLDLSHNQLNEFVVYLPDLVVLDLSNNNITSFFWEQLIWTSLETLDLSYNRLSGTISFNFRWPVYLEYVSLFGNELEGEIPPVPSRAHCDLRGSFFLCSSLQSSPGCLFGSCNEDVCRTKAQPCDGFSSCKDLGHNLRICECSPGTRSGNTSVLGPNEPFVGCNLTRCETYGCPDPISNTTPHCQDTTPTFHFCNCEAGYLPFIPVIWSSFPGCTDIDECSGQNDCTLTRQCVNLPGTFCCCPDGFYSNLSPPAYGKCSEPSGPDDPTTSCTEDINECKERIDDCDVPRQCLNTFGKFCCCPMGYLPNNTYPPPKDRNCSNGCIVENLCGANPSPCTHRPCKNQPGSDTGYICGPCESGYYKQ